MFGKEFGFVIENETVLNRARLFGIDFGHRVDQVVVARGQVRYAIFVDRAAVPLEYLFYLLNLLHKNKSVRF